MARVVYENLLQEILEALQKRRAARNNVLRVS